MVVWVLCQISEPALAAGFHVFLDLCRKLGIEHRLKLWIDFMFWLFLDPAPAAHDRLRRSGVTDAGGGGETMSRRRAAHKSSARRFSGK